MTPDALNLTINDQRQVLALGWYKELFTTTVYRGSGCSATVEHMTVVGSSPTSS